MNKLIYICFLSVVLNSCAPWLIREHQSVSETDTPSFRTADKSKCDSFITRIGSSSYYLKYDGIKNGQVHLYYKDGKLLFKLYIDGTLGSRIRIEGKSLKYKYSEGDWSLVESTHLSSTQYNRGWGVKDSQLLPPLEVPIVFDKEHLFAVESGYESNDVTFVASIPKLNQDLEIEAPKIYIDSKLILPPIIKFKWNSYLTVLPLNGC